MYEGNSFLHSACEQCVSILFDGISQEGDVVESKKFSPLLEHVRLIAIYMLSFVYLVFFFIGCSLLSPARIHITRSSFASAILRFIACGQVKIESV